MTRWVLIGGIEWKLMARESVRSPERRERRNIYTLPVSEGLKRVKKRYICKWRAGQASTLSPSHYRPSFSPQMVSFLATTRLLYFSLLATLGNKPCRTPKVRREWRDLSFREQAEWIDAVNVPIPLL